MKKLFNSNRTITILLLAVSLTFWGAIFALPMLGAWQIALTFYILYHKLKLSKLNREWVFSYIITTLSLVFLFVILHYFKIVQVLYLLFVWMFVSAFLSLFHLYITYKIKFLNEL